MKSERHGGEEKEASDSKERDNICKGLEASEHMPEEDHQCCLGEEGLTRRPEERCSRQREGPKGEELHKSIYMPKHIECVYVCVYMYVCEYVCECGVCVCLCLDGGQDGKKSNDKEIRFTLNPLEFIEKMT